MLPTIRFSSTAVPELITPTKTKTKTALMIHLVEEQSKLWQTALVSQKIEVAIQSPAVDLVALLEAYQNENNLPDLLIIDISVKSLDGNFLQASQVCRWNKSKKLNLNVVLVNPNQDVIGKVEQRWAKLQGAVDILPKLYEQNLVDSVRRVIEIVGGEFTENSLTEIFEYRSDSRIKVNPIAKIVESDTRVQSDSTVKANSTAQLDIPQSDTKIQIDTVANVDTSELAAQNAEFHFNQAIALLNQSDIQGAIEALSFAIQINPNYTEAYSKRADIYISIGEAQKAMEDYSRSLGIWHGDRM